DEEQFDDPSTKDNTESTNEEIQQQIKEQAEELEEQLQDLLSNEIEENMISIENDNGRIVIRIREKGSFDSGRASLKKSFIPILKVIADRLKDLPGKIVIAGHTDNIPIGKSKRNIFQSNWDLSTARAVTVLHKLLKVSKMKQNRFVIEGYADTMPIEDNKTKAGRAKNRRVELVVIQDYGDTSDEVKKEKEPVSSETNTAEEIIKSEGILKTEKVIESEKIIKPESVVKPSL
ncbi:MAG: OmpA family protein, partial [Methylococcales bacterium]|nr:OmpA family protein [Methylococcales bacterium]